jgi:hypothetical protein
MLDPDTPTPPQPADAPPPRKRRLPILVRHAISLLVVFVLAIPASVYIGTAIYRSAQLEKLESADEVTFDEGLAYVYANAAEDKRVREAAFEQLAELDPTRARRLLMALASGKDDDQPVAEDVYPAYGDIVGRLEIQSALGFYEDLLTVPGVDSTAARDQLLSNLSPKDDAELLLAVAYLDGRLLWEKDAVPRDLWLRWLLVVSNSSAEVAQHQAVRMLGELPDDLNDPRVAQALNRLSDSPHASVRAQVLNASAGYARIAKDPTDYEQLIFKLGGDANKTIARRAWMIVGHLNPFSGYAVNWKEADPFVAEAMLWASVKTNPQNPKAAIDAWQSGHEALSAMALYEAPLRGSDSPYSETFLLFQKSLVSPPQTTDDLLRIWRSAPALHDAWEAIFFDDPRSSLFPSLFTKLTPEAVRTSQYKNVVPALVYYGRVGFEPAQWAEEDNALVLAWIEGLQRGPLEIIEQPVPIYYQKVGQSMDEGGVLQWNDIERFVESDDLIDTAAINRYRYAGDNWYSILAAAGSDHPIYAETQPITEYASSYSALDFWVAVNAEQARNRRSTSPSDPPHLDTLRQVLTSHGVEHRTMAAWYAAMIEARPKLIAINEAFLRKHPDMTDDALHAKSNAELAELGLKRVDALAALLDAAKNAPASAGRQNEIKLLKLALWMRGDLGDDFTPKAEAMLFDKQLPTSTVLMCLLHMQRPIALEYLFGDTFQHPRGYLQELFIAERWWHVFRRFVDTSDLTLWLWGDPEAQAFQIEAMRQWYAVNRWRIERGWWPELIHNR